MFKGLTRRPVAVTMVLTAVMVLGVAAIRELPVSLVPDIGIPQITVHVSDPNRSARELNDLMIEPLRRQLVQMPHLQNMTCTARDGRGLIEMTFEYGSNAGYLFIGVNERVDNAMNSWPQDAERPVIMRASATDIPAFFINITLRDFPMTWQETGAYDRNRFMELGDFTRQVIMRRLEQLPQVAMTDISGQVFPQLLIVPDMAKLQALGIGEDRLGQAIQEADVHLGNLSIRDGEYRFDVRFENSVLTRRDVENVCLKIGDRVYRISDLASVREEQQRVTGMTSADSRQCLTLAVIKKSDARMSQLGKAIQELMDSFERDYPDLQFQITRDQTGLLEYSINNMLRNLLYGALFACLIIFFFMQDFRSPLLVVMTIPLSLILTFLFFHVLNISINIISLSGLVLGLGMMVDSSIITIDNITQRWQKGEPLEDACVRGTREVFAPMLASVLTTCAIFVPLIFMSGIAGALFYDEAMAVTVTLLSALMVSVLVIPVFYYQAYKGQPRFIPNRFIQRISLAGMNVGYERLLKWFFRHRGVMWGTFAAALSLSGVLFAALDKRKLPDISHSDTLISIEWNERIAVDAADRRCSQIVAQFPGLVEHYTCMSGIQQFTLPHTGEMGPSESTIYLKASSPRNLAEIEAGAGRYIRETWPGAVCSCRASGNIFDMLFADKEPPVVAHIRSRDGSVPQPGKLTELVQKISQALPHAGIQPVEWNSYIELVSDPERLALYNVSSSQIITYLQNAMNGNTVHRIRRGNMSMPVVTGAGGGDTQVQDLVQGRYIDSYGTRVPLEILLQETRGRDFKSITQGVDGEYYPLPLDVNGRQARHAMETVEKAVKANPDFDVSFTGSYFSNRRMIGELCRVLLVSVLLLFFILAAQFESLVQPLIILSELVIDIFAVLLALWITGQSINLMSMTGLVVMCGIVINDSILKVDTINRLRLDGRGLKRAVMEAGSRRLKAIVMTSLTTILAIAPFLVRGDMGSDLQYPLSLSLIAGMTAGTFVSVFFVPIAYHVIYRRQA